MMRKSLLKPKVTKPSTPPELLTRSGNWWEMMHPDSYKNDPSKEGTRKRLIYTLYVFFDEPDRIELDEFCLVHRLPPMTFRRWRDKYPDVGQAVDNIKIWIGVKRRLGVHLGKYNMASCYKDMHTLEPTWELAVDRYHADLKKAEEAVSREFNVIMTPAKAKDKDV